MTDPRLCCRITFNRTGELVPAQYLAPRHVGGNEDEPVEYIPISEQYVQGWYEDIAPQERLPMLTIRAFV